MSGSPHSVLVLGGGLSGLSAAFHLSRRFPAQSGTRITLVERAPRLGGWVQSERVRVRDKHGYEADMLLESGPRTLRPTSKGIMELIHLLKLESSILAVPRSAPAARNRFLYLHGSKGIVAIPGSIPSLLVSPLAKILVPAVLRDFRKTDRKVLNASTPDDESVDAFLSRHFGSQFAQMLGSALVHGIYAADSRQLSIRAAFAAMCRLEESGSGSVVRGALREMLLSRRNQDTSPELYSLGTVDRLLKGVSVYSFRDGMQTLTDAISKHLMHQENVQLIKGDPAVSLSKAANNAGFQVSTGSGRHIVASHLISALPLPLLDRLITSIGHSSDSMEPSSNIAVLSTTVITPAAPALKLPPPPFPHPALSARSGVPGRYQPSQSHEKPTSVSSVQPPSSDVVPVPSLPHVLSNPSSSVTVVNIVFPPTDTPIHPDGFGYLIPRPSPDYPSPPGSTLGILGTVFDSCALGGQDVSITANHRSPKFTKLTMMLGGPYGPPSPSHDSPEFVPALLAALQQHLGHAQPLPEPCLVRIREHRDCIPTPTVGHVSRMAELRAAIQERLGKNAAVIGAGVTGVSVGDCIESGRRAALDL
ncbi:hypothetical protein C8Q77DRAFT_352821 [Trametes polyzona]|nr:hypothetical protein C8Q77DRAFT_352821 [Trametes polyzona]